MSYFFPLFFSFSLFLLPSIMETKRKHFSPRAPRPARARSAAASAPPTGSASRSGRRRQGSEAALRPGIGRSLRRTRPRSSCARGLAGLRGRGRCLGRKGGCGEGRVAGPRLCHRLLSCSPSPRRHCRRLRCCCRCRHSAGTLLGTVSGSGKHSALREGAETGALWPSEARLDDPRWACSRGRASRGLRQAFEGEWRTKKRMKTASE